MSNFSNTNSTQMPFVYPDISFSYTLRFWIYLIGDIPSILCSIFVLYHLLFDRTLRNALNNHVIIVLLIIGLIMELTDVPWTLYYYQSGKVWQETPAFCIIWAWINFGFYVTQLLVFAWATLERHILIFHDQWVSTKIKRLFVHYLPLTIILTYCFVFFAVVFVFPPCENWFVYTSLGCLYTCIYYNRSFSLWDSIFNQICPTLVISLSSIALLIRVLCQKRRMRQQIHWQKYRKMTIQLLSISILYIVLYLPFMLVRLSKLLGVAREFGRYFSLYAVFFSYYVQFLFPFVCAGSLPELRKKLKKLLWWCRLPTRIMPQRLDGALMRENQSNAPEHNTQ